MSKIEELYKEIEGIIGQDYVTDEDFIDGQTVADMSNPTVELTQAGDSTIFASGDSKLFHINVASDWTGAQGSPTITGVVTIAWTFMGA